MTDQKPGFVIVGTGDEFVKAVEAAKLAFEKLGDAFVPELLVLPKGVTVHSIPTRYQDPVDTGTLRHSFPEPLPGVRKITLDE